MIISASRRTDIPAFYSEWLLNRLRQGFVLVRNPMNFQQVSRVLLTPESVECLVFWTKNPREMLTRLPAITQLGYPFYFLFTLTAYDLSIEQNVPEVQERIAIFRTLAAQTGKEKVIWRYDPIIFTDHLSPAFHCEAFTRLAESLSGFTSRCIVSFLQMYRKCERNMKSVALTSPPMADQLELLQTLRSQAAAQGITLQSCAQASAVEQAGIPPGRCIDDALITAISGAEIRAGRDKNQRKECGCVESIDIGAYNSCPHHCLYCYANSDKVSVARNLAAHDPESPLLYGHISQADRIIDRPLKTLSQKQLRLF